MARNKIPDIRAQTLPEHGMAGCAVSAACRITTCHTRMCSWAQVQPNFSLHAQQTMHTHVALRRAAGARAAYMRGRRDCAQASADRDVRVQHRRGPHQNRELINSADSRMLDRSSPYLTHQRIECKTRTQGPYENNPHSSASVMGWGPAKRDPGLGTNPVTFTVTVSRCVICVNTVTLQYTITIYY